jgi:hypothetical protein
MVVASLAQVAEVAELILANLAPVGRVSVEGS